MQTDRLTIVMVFSSSTARQQMDDFTPCMSFLNSGMLGVAPVSLGALGGAGACFWPVCMSLVQYRPRGTRGMRLRSFLPPVTQLDYTAATCLLDVDR